MSDIITQKEEKIIIDFANSVSELLDVLGSREKDILEKRFRLQAGSKKKHTLEDIGKLYEITRERVRQIEADSIKKLKQIDESHPSKKTTQLVMDSMKNFLKKHGGVAQEDYLIDELMCAFTHADHAVTEEQKRRNREALSFIISQILSENFDKIETKDKYHPVWKLKEISWTIIEGLVGLLVDVIEKENKPILQNDLISMVKGHGDYEKLKDEFVKHVEHLKGEMREIEDIFVSYMSISKKLKRNLFSEWGLSHWNTISPKKINDKIYLILKKSSKPLHFNEITEQINKAQFDHKKACAATVHNELILDKKYVLVGRGIYALKEWGYEPGTVSDVIVQILKNKGELNKSEIMEEVNKQRIVKQATVNLALMNKHVFKKLPDGKYGLMGNPVILN